jgi:hypothetical protein
MHKPILRLQKGRLTVSCDCRAVLGKYARNPVGEYFEPMYAEPSDSTLWDTYNNPENHWAPFDNQDRITR